MKQKIWERKDVLFGQFLGNTCTQPTYSSLTDTKRSICHLLGMPDLYLQTDWLGQKELSIGFSATFTSVIIGWNICNLMVISPVA